MMMQNNDNKRTTEEPLERSQTECDSEFLFLYMHILKL